MISVTTGRRPGRALAFLSLPLILTACGTGGRGGPIPYEVKDFGPPDAPSATILGADYHIAPLDTLSVTVFQVPDLSGEFQVDLTGHVAMPLIGSVKAVDLTTEQLTSQLEAQLGRKYLKNPDVTVGIVSSTRNNVTVEGAVQQSGVFPITGPTTLMQAIALARGLHQDANPRRVAIFRQIEGKRMAAAFDLTDIRRGLEEDPRVYRGDIIVVDGSRLARDRRELLQSLGILRVFVPVL